MLADRHATPPPDPLAGVAAARGMLWAEAVAAAYGWELRSGRVHRRGRELEPWPAYAGKAAAIARRKVAGLTTAPAELERLAVVCHASAARWWAQLS